MSEGQYYISRVWAVERDGTVDTQYCVVCLTPELRKAVQTMRKHFDLLGADIGKEVCHVEVDFRVMFWLKQLPSFLMEGEEDDAYSMDLTEWEPLPAMTPVEVLAGAFSEEPGIEQLLSEKEVAIAVRGSSIVMYSLPTFFFRCREYHGVEGDTEVFSKEMMDYLTAEVDDG